ncbi:MAG: hypothetical protein WC763_07470 [Candidatus Paceibacterota bacterium]
MKQRRQQQSQRRAKQPTALEARGDQRERPTRAVAPAAAAAASSSRPHHHRHRHTATRTSHHPSSSHHRHRQIDDRDHGGGGSGSDDDDDEDDNVDSDSDDSILTDSSSGDSASDSGDENQKRRIEAGFNRLIQSRRESTRLARFDATGDGRRGNIDNDEYSGGRREGGHRPSPSPSPSAPPRRVAAYAPVINGGGGGMVNSIARASLSTSMAPSFSTSSPSTLGPLGYNRPTDSLVGSSLNRGAKRG